MKNMSTFFSTTQQTKLTPFAIHGHDFAQEL